MMVHFDVSSSILSFFIEVFELRRFNFYNLRNRIFTSNSRKSSFCRNAVYNYECDVWSLYLFV